MPMLPNQPAPQQNLPTATNAAMSAAQKPQANPQGPTFATPPQAIKNPQPQKPAKPNDASKFQGQGGDDAIMKNLEEHLNNLPDKQKSFLAGALQHYPNIVIPFVGIVCGQEVFQYFVNIYKHNFQAQGAQPGQPQQGQNPQAVPHPATGQPNSAPAPQAGPNTGQPPVQPQPQQ